MMNDLARYKPAPERTHLTEAFWDGARAGRLLMQKCTACATVNFLPRASCVECGERSLKWVPVGPSGVVYAYTVTRTVMMNSPIWAAELPVILCIVDVDAGARMYGQLTHCRSEDVRVGLRVSVYFEDDSGAPPDSSVIPRFRPDAASDAAPG